MPENRVKQLEPGEVVLSARGLGKTFGGFAAVKDVNIDIRHARVHALIGPNGAGKTTVFNLLTKFLQPTSGSIELLGKDITSTSSDKVARMGLVRSFQISSVFPHLTVHENVRVALQRPNRLAAQFWKPLSSLNFLDKQACELLDMFGLLEFRRERAVDLPYGLKRVLEIATTRALDPEVMLLDEPLAGLGQEDVHRIADIIHGLSKTRAVLMVEHNLAVVANICDQVTVLQRGQIIADGDYDAVSKNPEVRTAYMGSAI